MIFRVVLHFVMVVVGLNAVTSTHGLQEYADGKIIFLFYLLYLVRYLIKVMLTR